MQHQSQEMSSEAKEELKESVDETLGNPEVTAESAKENPNSPEHDELPEFAKKRLGMQEKRHKKELRKLQQQLDEVRAHIGSRPEPQYSPEDGMDPYNAQTNHGDLNNQVHAAVLKALRYKEEQEGKAKQEEMMRHAHKRYQEFSDHLDNASTEYEDFDDVIKSDDAPYTGVMRDMAMILHGIPGIDSAKTLYHLGKDREKLGQLSKLHPVDQAKEVVKIAIALMNSGGKQAKSSQDSRPLGQIKNNPITSTNVNENTSVSDLRKRMKEGGKRWA
jgi:hypothetical protein